MPDHLDLLEASEWRRDSWIRTSIGRSIVFPKRLLTREKEFVRCVVADEARCITFCDRWMCYFASYCFFLEAVPSLVQHCD